MEVKDTSVCPAWKRGHVAWRALHSDKQSPFPDVFSCFRSLFVQIIGILKVIVESKTTDSSQFVFWKILTFLDNITVQAYPRHFGLKQYVCLKPANFRQSLPVDA